MHTDFVELTADFGRPQNEIMFSLIYPYNRYSLLIQYVKTYVIKHFIREHKILI